MRAVLATSFPSSTSVANAYTWRGFALCAQWSVLKAGSHTATLSDVQVTGLRSEILAHRGEGVDEAQRRGGDLVRLVAGARLLRAQAEGAAQGAQPQPHLSTSGCHQARCDYMTSRYGLRGGPRWQCYIDTE